MSEQSKTTSRRWREANFLTRYFVGDGIDVGVDPDGLGRNRDLFPAMGAVRGWDEEVDGDAQYLMSVPDASCDFLHSSYCLQDIPDPYQALTHWLRVVKPGGYLVVTVPDEDSYVHGASPSRFNAEQYKRTFTLHKPVATSWSARSLNVLDLLRAFSGAAELELAHRIHGFLDIAPDAVLPAKVDQALPSSAGGSIAFVLHKRRQPLSSPAAPSRQALIDRALRLYGSKEYAAVLDLLDNHAWLAGQSPDILNAAGASAFALKSPVRALELYRRATVLMSGHYDAWNNLGIVLFTAGKFQEAEAAHRQAIALQPDSAQFKGDLVAVLIRTQRLDEAQVICEAELAKTPDSMFFLGELATVYTRQRRLAEAQPLFERLLALRPGEESVALNVGVRLFQAGQYAQAEALYRQAMARFSGELARFYLSLLLLLTGRLEEGWANYSARTAVRKEALPAYQFPLWQGEPIAGKRLLISHEQGFGDEVMICRYVTELRAAGAARVGLICRRQMRPLLKTLDGVELLTPESGDEITLRDGEFDYWTLPFEIPRYLGTRLETIPAKVPYLSSLPERRRLWAERLPEAGLKVGLVWKGSTIHPMDAERSLASLKQLAPLWQVPGVQFVSLQKGQGEDEVQPPPSDQPLLDLGTSIVDFADTAAIVDQLDLIIAVDTAVVHVAGALNKPCWVLLPYYATDWRWLLEREDSPWYPSVRLFRQDSSGDWSAVIERLAAELARLVRQQVVPRAKDSLRKISPIKAIPAKLPISGK